MEQQTGNYYVELTLIVDVTEVFVNKMIKFIPKPKKVATLHSEQYTDGWVLQKIKETMLEELGFTSQTPHHFIPVMKPKKYAPITYRIKKERRFRYGQKH